MRSHDAVAVAVEGVLSGAPKIGSAIRRQRRSG
jgi:hypothetical protein